MLVGPAVGSYRQADALFVKFPSVITSKPAISYHFNFKTGQRSHAQDQMMFYRAGRCSGKCLLK